jgi:hypothetical protein
MRNEEDWMNYFSLHISMAKILSYLTNTFSFISTKEEFTRRFFIFYFKFMLWLFLWNFFILSYFQKHEFYVKLMDEALSQEMKWVIKNLSNWWIIFTMMPVAICMLLSFVGAFVKSFSAFHENFYFWHFLFGLCMLIGC